jgi:hypothetical protein
MRSARCFRSANGNFFMNLGSATWPLFFIYLIKRVTNPLFMKMSPFAKRRQLKRGESPAHNNTVTCAPIIIGLAATKEF